MKVQFTISGETYSLSTEDVEGALSGKEPERIFDYAVWVDGRWYPPKQALVTPIGLKNHNVNSRTAYNILRKLGFPHHDQRIGGPLPDAPGDTVERGADTELRKMALKLAVHLMAGGGRPAADAVATADEFLTWLTDA